MDLKEQRKQSSGGRNKYSYTTIQVMRYMYFYYQQYLELLNSMCWQLVFPNNESCGFYIS